MTFYGLSNYLELHFWQLLSNHNKFLIDIVDSLIFLIALDYLRQTWSILINRSPDGFDIIHQLNIFELIFQILIILPIIVFIVVFQINTGLHFTHRLLPWLFTLPLNLSLCESHNFLMELCFLFDIREGSLWTGSQPDNLTEEFPDHEDKIRLLLILFRYFKTQSKHYKLKLMETESNVSFQQFYCV